MKRIPGSSRSAAITPQSCTPGSPNTTRTPSLKSCFTSASPPVIRAISGLLPTEHDVAAHEGQQGNNIPDSRFGAIVPLLTLAVAHIVFRREETSDGPHD